MKISIDVTSQHTANRFRGVGVYTRLLTRALREFHAIDMQCTVVTDGKIPKDTDLIHFPFFDLFFRTLNPGREIPFVITVHDLIPLRFSNHYWPGVRGSIRQIFQVKNLHRASAIITDSKKSKIDIHELLQVDNKRIHPVYLAADPDLQPPPTSVVDKVLTRFQLARPYWLYVGDINYNKNIPSLLRAFSQLKQPDLLLVLVSKALGDARIPESQEIHHLIDTLNLGEQVRILTTVPLTPKNELAALYAGAHWYVQPSLYEGFGLPVLEAMQCGAPVISSLGGSLKEIVSDENAVTFNPESEEQMVLALERALHMSNTQRLQLIKSGAENANHFSWQKTAQQTAQVYQKVLQRS